MIKRVPTPDVVELEGKPAWDALASFFGVEEVDTAPLPLDELPAQPELETIERERWARVLAPLDDAARRPA